MFYFADNSAGRTVGAVALNTFVPISAALGAIGAYALVSTEAHEARWADVLALPAAATSAVAAICMQIPEALPAASAVVVVAAISFVFASYSNRAQAYLPNEPPKWFINTAIVVSFILAAIGIAVLGRTAVEQPSLAYLPVTGIAIVVIAILIMVRVLKRVTANRSTQLFDPAAIENDEPGSSDNVPS
jgi:hypothetical protein